MRIPILLLIILSGALWLNSCDAPHDNPLDPSNPDSRLYIIEGNVYTSDAAVKPIAGVKVNWSVDNVTTTTDKNGYFKIQSKELKDGWLYFSGSGFSTDSQKVIWNGLKKYSLRENLNDVPSLDSISIYSSITNKYSGPEYQLTFDIYVSDADDDIDSVNILCPGLSINQFIPKITSGHFNGKFSDLDLGLTSFDELIGKNFDVYAKTVKGIRFYVGTSDVKRIIHDEIEIISPINSDTLSTNNPLLRWKRYLSGFSFNYRLEIYTDEPEPKLLWSLDNVSSDSISILVDKIIKPTADNNKFFWDIWCIDEYKDQARSKPASFVILN
jgi:hypothetical protein